MLTRHFDYGAGVMSVKNSITIRPARLSDLHAINRVRTGAVLDMIGPHSRLVREGHVHNPHLSFRSPRYWQGAMVAVVNGSVVGVAQTHGAKLSDLWVEHSRRSKGIGAKLAHEAEKRIRQRGFRMAHLFTAGFNARGRIFYERNGWALARFTQHRVCHFRRCVYVKRL